MKRLSKPVKLVMIGFGPLEGTLKAYAAKMGIDRDVIWPGAISGAAHMAAFDVLAHCSRSEASAYVLLEAAASGVPVVATRVGAAQELIEAGQAGFICEPWGVERFAELVLRILTNPSVSAQLSQNARNVASRFDLRTMVEKTCSVYDMVAPVRRNNLETRVPTPAGDLV
jgi:glycosyltransferase involved in cell wall biosynthesis